MEKLTHPYCSERIWFHNARSATFLAVVGGRRPRFAADSDGEAAQHEPEERSNLNGDSGVAVCDDERFQQIRESSRGGGEENRHVSLLTAAEGKPRMAAARALKEVR